MNPTSTHAINIPSTSGFSFMPEQNHPCADLLNGSREDYFNICVPMYKASISGDWAAAEVFLNQTPELVRYSITENFETVLHVAASAESTKLTDDFVRNLVGRMQKEDLELQNMSSNTALCIAAAAGSVKMAQIMMQKNSTLASIPGQGGMMPLYHAALYGRHDMVRYLFDASWTLTDNYWSNENRSWLLLKCVECDLFDVALNIVREYPELARSASVLGVLARKPYALNRIERNLIRSIINSIFAILHMKLRLTEKHNDALLLLQTIWIDEILTMSKKEVADMLRGPAVTTDGMLQYPSRILFVAAEMGNTTFVVEILRAYPDLIWKKNDDGLTIFHIAVMNRHQGIYNLLYEIGSMKDLITPLKDKDGNNMLHLVGMTSVKMRSQMSGATLLMQREVLWFKEVEMIMLPSDREKKNGAGETPYELFSKNNNDLASQGLKWMKDCMVVATLIVTVAFAVAFTVPGGYNQDNGIPMFIHERTFLVFVIADAISLFASSASLLMFLSILTSRFGQRDFLNSLPRKLMIGLVTLFISITAMMVTFGVSFFVLYHNRLKWVPILIGVLAAMPVLLFATLQLPLLVDMFRSTYDSRYLFKPKKRMLYTRNPRY